MGTLDRDLHEVVALNHAVRPKDAEARLNALLADATGADLRANIAQIQVALDSFLPKRRKSLQAVLTTALQSAPPHNAHAGEAAVSNATNDNENPVKVSDGISAESVGTTSQAPESHPALQAHANGGSTLSVRLGRAHDDTLERLAAIQQLTLSVRPTEAESALTELVNEIDHASLVTYEASIRRVVAGFLPKRRKRLEWLLIEALTAASNEDDAGPDETIPSQTSTLPLGDADVEVGGDSGAEELAQSKNSEERPVEMAALGQVNSHANRVEHVRKRFNESLDELSRHHIFAWATDYRDTLAEYFDVFFDETCIEEKRSIPLNVVRSAMTHHSREIFTKGHKHVTKHWRADAKRSTTKSLAGLQRFLDLPLEFYSTKLADVQQREVGLQLRELTSAMLFGIAYGFAMAKLSRRGGTILAESPRTWAHIIPFLTSQDLNELLVQIDKEGFASDVQDAVTPLVEAVDKFLERDPRFAPLPAIAEFVAPSNRLDVSLQLSPSVSDSRLLDIQCYLAGKDTDAAELEDASAAAVCAVLAHLTPETHALVASVERLSNIVVPIGSKTEGDPSERMLNHLHRAVYAQGSTAGPERPIIFNYAKAFPVENPFLTKYYHVYRFSVRRLMQSFERRNGVRLWCSVRRSGKTTACASDLGTSTNQSLLLTQTCSRTGQLPDGHVFYQEMREAIGNGSPIDDDFVWRAVERCASRRLSANTRVILVLDEYETLFGNMSTAVDADPRLRYTVVQPLLDQLVAFTRDNLLVLMGQQPNAHHILMDQNQLSPVVEQDPFPLFSHDVNRPGGNEFSELLRKVLTSHVELEANFVNAVFNETGGHPFLTVNLLVAFMQWLIENRYPHASLTPASEEIFRTFASSNLTANMIAQSGYYDFFVGASKEALSPRSRLTDPWLYSAYSVLRAISLDSPDTLTYSMSDYVQSARRYCQGMSPHELLASATRNNFLSTDRATVRPAIPILSRVAGSVTPA